MGYVYATYGISVMSLLMIGIVQATLYRTSQRKLHQLTEHRHHEA